jgi:hypothetical protein
VHVSFRPRPATLAVAAALALSVLPALPVSAAPSASGWTALGHGKRVVVRGVPGDGRQTMVAPVDRAGRTLSGGSTLRPGTRAQAPRALSATPLSNIVVSYDADFQANSAAMASFEAAVSIWEHAVASPVNILVTAELNPLPTGQLGGAGPSNFYGSSSVLYPVALANALASEQNGTPTDLDPGDDIGAEFSNNATYWYFGTDGVVPSDKYDFESVVLHELGHGLGFLGSVEQGSTDAQAHYTNPPFIYDYFTETSDGTPILDYPNNSAPLTAAVTSAAVYWVGAHGASADRGRETRLYAPTTGFESGSSYSHLSDSSYGQGDPDSLMTPVIGTGDAVHDPGEVMLGMFRDMGWVTPGLPGSTFTPLTPTRVLDTGTTLIGNGQHRDLLLAGTSGVPADATAVILNVTTALPASASVVRVYPLSRADGAPVPGVSNVNTAKGDNRANLVTVPLSTGGPPDGSRAGRVRLLNSGGAARLVADLAGYYSPTATTYFHPLSAPVRKMDTRIGTGVPKAKVGAGGVVDLTVTGGSVPATATAVALTVTAVKPTTNTYVSVYPTGSPQTTSNVNLTRGAIAANAAVVQVPASGQIRFRNNAGAIDLVADVAGYYDTTAAGGTLFRPTLPTRLLDTRPGKVGSGATRDIVVAADANGVPTAAGAATSAVVNLTGVTPSVPTFLTAYPTGAAVPNASNLNLAAGQTAASLAFVKLGTGGRIRVRNAAGMVALVVDLSGWFGPA